MRTAKLYVITNLVNDKQYYGWAMNIVTRWTNHKAGRGSLLVHKDIQKYGIENFKFEILCEGEVSFIKDLEQIMIEQECSKVPYGYNRTTGGEGEIGILTGPLNPRAIPVTVNSVEYGCIKDAALDLGCHPEVLRRQYRIYGSIFNYKLYDSKRRSESNTRKKHTEETKRILRQKALKRDTKLSRHSRARRVLVNGKEYGCMKEASIEESINYSTLRDRFQRFQKTNSWPVGYAYLNS